MLLASAVRPPAIQSPTPVLVMTDQERDERHEWQHVLEDHVDGVPARLVQGGDDAADELAHLGDHIGQAVTNPFFLAGGAVSTLL